MTTLREHLEAIHDACTPDDSSQYEPPRAVLCREHALAALAILNAADYREGWADEWAAWIHDPQHPKAPA